MGVNIHSYPIKAASTENNYTPEHLQDLFNEYLKRYYQLLHIRSKEMKCSLCLAFLGFTNLMFLLGAVNTHFIICACTIILFLLALKQYYKIHKQLKRAYVNFHILHHHFLGKLEVGFCNHTNECKCVENFINYAWDKYGINFYNNNINIDL